MSENALSTDVFLFSNKLHLQQPSTSQPVAPAVFCRVICLAVFLFKFWPLPFNPLVSYRPVANDKISQKRRIGRQRVNHWFFFMQMPEIMVWQFGCLGNAIINETHSKKHDDIHVWENCVLSGRYIVARRSMTSLGTVGIAIYVQDSVWKWLSLLKRSETSPSSTW